MRSQNSRTNLHCCVAVISLFPSLWQLYSQKLSYLHYMRMTEFSFHPRFCLITFQKWFVSLTILASWKRNSRFLSQLITFTKLFFLCDKTSNYSWNLEWFNNDLIGHCFMIQHTDIFLRAVVEKALRSVESMKKQHELPISVFAQHV